MINYHINEGADNYQKHFFKISSLTKGLLLSNKNNENFSKSIEI